MAKQSTMTLWQPPETEIVPANVNQPAEIAAYAKQLSQRDRKQIVQGLQGGNYEMVVNFVWTKAATALKRELASLGMQFLGEMLNKPDITDDDDVLDVVTDQEAVRLAEELGVVSSTEAMRLRQTQEMVAHFFRLDAAEIDREDAGMEETEAVRALKACVRNILGKPKLEVATKFAEFRRALETETLQKEDHRVETLQMSPYFFRKLTVSILLAVIKSGSGARLENSLANINLLLPLLWKGLRDTEKWQIGHTYAEVHAAGQSTAMSGLKQALLKVGGFDYVPESLRSDTFVKAAENVIKAHESFNNYYNEDAPMNTLSKLGSTIPMPAFAICASAILAVRLGNSYGVSWYASPTAEKMLGGFTPERWQYYLNQCLPGDVRVISKLLYEKPRKNWYELTNKFDFANLAIKNKDIAQLLAASAKRDDKRVETCCAKLREAYYGKGRE